MAVNFDEFLETTEVDCVSGFLLNIESRAREWLTKNEKYGFN